MKKNYRQWPPFSYPYQRRAFTLLILNEKKTRLTSIHRTSLNAAGITQLISSTPGVNARVIRQNQHQLLLRNKCPYIASQSLFNIE